MVKLRIMGWAGLLASMREIRNAYRIYQKRPLRRPKCNRENSIKMKLVEIYCEVVN
jgi:hypothetical protein